MQDYFSTINYLVLELNSQCNLRCIHCTRESLVQAGLRDPKFMSESELISLLDQLQDCPIDTIKIEGLSEPMMFPQFAERAALIRERFPKAHIIVISNLQYEPSRTSFFATLDLCNAFYISVDGIAGMYEKIRAGARWDRFVRSLEQIHSRTAAEERKKIFLNFTATPENYTQLPEIYSLCSRYDLGGVRINLVQNWDEKSANTHRFTREQLDFLRQYQKDIKGVDTWQYHNCFWVFNGIVIDVFGDVRQCIINTTQEPLGNAFQTPLKDIFNLSPRLQHSRNLLAQNTPPPECRFCDYKGLTPALSHLFEGMDSKNTPRAVVKKV